MRIAVTGAGGFVGGALTAHFAARGARVAAVVRRAPPRPLGDATVVLSDIARDVALPGPLDALIHCAAEVPAFCPDPDRLYAANVAAARNVFAAAIAAGASAIVFCSSMSVYGRISVPVVDEMTAPDAPDAYGRSKMEGERLLAEFVARHPGLAGLSLRLPGMVGAGARNNFLAGVMAAIAAGGPVVASNPDAQFNNVVHVADLAAFLERWLAGRRPGNWCAPLGARAPLPVRDVLQAMIAASGRDVALTFSPQPPKPSFLISTRCAEALGYAPATTRDSVERFVRDSLAAAS